ncbi:MAG: HAMP domain-containing histidine kinase [Chitinophagaceae bacterium]|nr:HAMP domain-containing histidine kinase [Oligoflexus sp.]
MKSLMVRVIKRLTHPIVVFVGLQVVWVTIVILWVVWFLGQRQTFDNLKKIIGTSSNLNPTTGIFTLIIGCVLLGIILLGTVVLFVFTQVQSSLIRQQQSFVSSVTHEIRSPLASLQLSFETLQRHKLAEATRDKIFGMVNKDLERLSVLVERILIAGRLDQGIIDYKSSHDEIDVKELIQHILEQQVHLDSQLNSRITVDCQNNLILQGSRLGLSIILGNLVENAIKYSPSESPIHILVKIKDYEVWISVEDKGIGLNKKDARKVFKMFHRSPQALARAVPGTGLGLYIVRSIAVSMGGRIWVESEGIGNGTRFTLAVSRSNVLST